MANLPISSQERAILRDLAKKVSEIAALPVMEERKRRWNAHNSLKPGRPLVLVFPEGSWSELITPEHLKCEDPRARDMEIALRRRIYAHEHFQSDLVCTSEWTVLASITSTGWGLWAHWKGSKFDRGAKIVDPVLNSYEDFKLLQHPQLKYDEAATKQNLAEAQELFGDILDVRLKGKEHISYHLMSIYIGLRGIDRLMEDFYEEPEFLHDVMRFFTEGYKKELQQLIDLNLLSLNNDNAYHSTGGTGWTDELPASGFSPERVRPEDMWASAEVQELTGVSPEHHYEFAMQYEKELLAPFGLNGYGCCDDLTGKLDLVCALPKMRRISISPFADVDRCAPQLGNRFIMSWKPQPSHLIGEFDAEKVRNYIQHTIDVAAGHGCVLEIILKDTHTCEKHPERFDQWSKIAWDLVSKAQ